MKRTNTQKGITLVALIITIILLLILAVVAISAVRNDGIIEYAKNARNEYEKAQKEENDMLAYFEKQLETKGEVGKWVQNKTKLTKVNEDGTVEELEVGDLIENYESSTNTAIKWRVLGAEDGKVLLVSATNLKDKVELSGKEGYNTGIQTLNGKCAVYANGIGAVEGSGRSINIEDINRVTGYNPLKTGTGEPFYDYNSTNGKVGQYLNKVTYTITKAGNVYYSSDLAEDGESNYKTFEHVDGTVLVKESEYTEAEGTAESITVESTHYGYYPVSLSLNDKTDVEVKGISTESNAYELLFAGTKTTDNYYWLGDMSIFAWKGKTTFSSRCVAAESVTSGTLWISNEGAKTKNFGVRAVVSLQSNVQFTSTGENTYTISISEE